ncbi:MAG: galactokinase [Proteobacteria bacterium]|nr:MAG: galactokinase [Pseudomonadota bacterium]
MTLALGRIPVAILAGGLGTRLRPAIGERAKVVAEIEGRPFLARLLDQLAAAGFRDVVLCVGFRADEVEAALGAAYGPLRLRYAREPAPLGTAGALANALPLLDAPDVLVMNGDSYCEVDLAAAWTRHRARGADATLVVVEVADASRYGRVELAADDRVVRFAEKQAGAGAGWINAGIYLLARARLAAIEPGRALSLERDVMPGWIGSGLFAHRTRGRFIDIGTPASYAEAARFFAG